MAVPVAAPAVAAVSEVDVGWTSSDDATLLPVDAAEPAVLDAAAVGWTSSEDAGPVPVEAADASEEAPVAPTVG